MLEVVAGHVLRQRSAELHDLAGCDDDLEPRHPGSGDPVLVGVRATGVGGDVPADLRLLGRARIGREEKASFAREPPYLARPETGLDVDPPE